MSVADPAVSPDGTAVAVVVSRVDLDANRSRSAIWVVPAGSTDGRPVTSGDHADSQPRWSPDGSRLAFTRTHGEGDARRTSLLVLPVAGPGEAIEVASTTESIGSVDWSPDGTRLAWRARVPEVAPDLADRDRPPRRITRFLSRIDDEGWIIDRPSQVLAAPADGSGPARQLTSGPFEHDGARWSPDGRTIVVAAARHDDWDLDEVVDLWLLDVDGPAGADGADGATGPAPIRRLTDGVATWTHPSWSPDGTRIAAVRYETATGWHQRKPMVIDVASGAAVDLAPGIDRSFAPYPGERAPVWEGDDTVLVPAEDRGRVVVFRLPTDPAAGSTTGAEPQRVLDGDRVVYGFDAAAGVVAAVVSEPTRPAELEVDGVRTSFTADFVAAVPPRPVERFTVPSPAGDGDIDTWLITPDGWDGAATAAGERWPLLLIVHGGPMTQYGDRWFDEFQLLAGAGFVVVAANPHGSSGREQSWARAIRSPKAAVDPGTGWGGIDADDVLAVVDATLERWPALDPARVGVLGGSYGGFMTSWLLARTDRFAAGCSERAVNNLLSEEWSSDVGGSFHRELGVVHLDDPDEYLRMSPITYVRDITAPILIIHSEDDLRCHPEQADALFIALRMLRHPDVEYWRFPGEGHEMSRSGSPKHRIRRAELINAFFERTIGSGPRG